MSGLLKLKSEGGGSVTLAANSALASDITVTAPTQAGTLSIVGPTFRANLGTTQTPSLSTWTKILYDTEHFDTAGAHTLGKFQPLVAGYYQINWSASMQASSGNGFETILEKNGSYWNYGSYAVGASNGTLTSLVSSGTDLVYLNGSTDYVEVYGYLGSGTSPQINGGSLYNTTFSAFLARAA